MLMPWAACSIRLSRSIFGCGEKRTGATVLYQFPSMFLVSDGDYTVNVTVDRDLIARVLVP